MSTDFSKIFMTQKYFMQLEEGTTLCIEIFQGEWNPGKVTR
jgi:hypothetical protein